MKQLRSIGLVAVICLIGACNASTVQAYINLAVNIALQVAKLAGLPSGVANQVSGDLATVNKLISDYQTADAAAKPGKLSEIDTYLNVAQQDLINILGVARVSDPKLQSVIQASIGIAITAVESIRALENGKPPTPVKQLSNGTVRVLTVGIVPKGKPLTPAQLKQLYNQTVSAYPQAQLH